MADLELRASELFPGGTTVPAVKPRLPPTARQLTHALVVAAFDASKGVALTRGELCKAEVVGYLLADVVGIEILKEETMRLGENASKVAVAAKEGAQRLKNGVSAKRTKLRKKATKDAKLAARLDADLEQLDSELAAALHGHWHAPRALAGLPGAESKVLKGSRKRKQEADPIVALSQDQLPRTTLSRAALWLSNLNAQGRGASDAGDKAGV